MEAQILIKEEKCFRREIIDLYSAGLICSILM
ncbi:hypothetical protein BXY85_1588 [Roseivirga pacifica]|uniref:Uncharacterized protein n=2 Tax=Roseivirga pacifica TaxID=1267423 RepID=A0A1I0MQD0_9BACT|nr:hypothetical protein BXY85_1588 [Roseivirga pacifica]SEV90157.1 hypothetical protein SAMN05216290_0572 [Roseivirga pacifica]